MKNTILLCLMVVCFTATGQAQEGNPDNKVVITTREGKTIVNTNEYGGLVVNLSPGDVDRFKQMI